MNAKVIPFSGKKAPLSSDKIKEKIHTECEKIISFCMLEHEGKTFLQFEKELWELLSYMGILYIQLFLMSSHERLNYQEWLNTGLYYARLTPTAKTIKTVFGRIDRGRFQSVDNKSDKPSGCKSEFFNICKNIRLFLRMVAISGIG